MTARIRGRYEQKVWACKAPSRKPVWVLGPGLKVQHADDGLRDVMSRDIGTHTRLHREYHGSLHAIIYRVLILFVVQLLHGPLELDEVGVGSDTTEHGRLHDVRYIVSISKRHTIGKHRCNGKECDILFVRSNPLRVPGYPYMQTNVWDVSISVSRVLWLQCPLFWRAFSEIAAKST